jgi:alcohol dehydrogenase
LKGTYRAMQIISPGVLELVERSKPVPGIGEVLIAVESCGVCGADISDIYKVDTNQRHHRVPGHEVVGRIVEIGKQVSSIWKVGQRVGVGRMGGHCNECDMCRQGNFHLCANQPYTGATKDGGYAELMIARSTGLVVIPQELSSEEAAPILCAGLATFNALRKSGAQAGDTVAIVGIGGLGHMAVQYARKMGYKVVAVGRGNEIADAVLSLGAHVYIDSVIQDTVTALKHMGGAKIILTMINNRDTLSSLIGGLSPLGRLILLNPTSELSMPLSSLVSGERQINGSLTGTPYDNERALNFSVLVDARPKIELVPFEDANLAIQRLKSGNVRFRMVLSMKRVGTKKSELHEEALY